MDYVSVKSRYLEKIQLQQLEENESQEKLIKKLDSLKEILENSGFFQSIINKCKSIKNRYQTFIESQVEKYLDSKELDAELKKADAEAAKASENEELDPNALANSTKKMDP